MKLARYNEFLIAVVGTLGLLGLVAFVGSLMMMFNEPRPTSGVAVKERDASLPTQRLVFCPALTDATGAYQYIPVSLVAAEDANEGVSLRGSGPSTRKGRFFDDCTLGRYGASSRIFNVVIRRMGSEQQSLLLDHPGQVVDLALPSDRCAKGKGATPCGTAMWKLRNLDSNHDGNINGEDALAAYVSDLDGQALTALSPADATVLDVQWLSTTATWQLQVRHDVDQDGQYSNEDGSVLIEANTTAPALAQPFVQQSILTALEAAIK